MNNEAPVVKEPTREELTRVKDLFGLSHDLLAQATFPGHHSLKVAEAMQFLMYHFKAMEDAIKRIPEAAPTPVMVPFVNPVVIADVSK